MPGYDRFDGVGYGYWVSSREIHVFAKRGVDAKYVLRLNITYSVGCQP